MDGFAPSVRGIPRNDRIATVTTTELERVLEYFDTLRSRYGCRCRTLQPQYGQHQPDILYHGESIDADIRPLLGIRVSNRTHHVVPVGRDRRHRRGRIFDRLWGNQLCTIGIFTVPRGIRLEWRTVDAGAIEIADLGTTTQNEFGNYAGPGSEHVWEPPDCGIGD